MNKLALSIVASLLVASGAARAQGGFSVEEQKAIEQASQIILERCRRTPLLEPSTGKDNASSFDAERYCGCQANALKAEVTPELMRRNSPREGAMLRDDIQRRCQAVEYLAAFARDCPSIVARTQDLDANARRGRRLKNAGGAQSLCSCLVRRMREKPAADFLEDAQSGVAMIRSSRRTSGPIDLDVVEQADLNACGWRLETAAAGAPPAQASANPAPATAAATTTVVDKADLAAMARVIDGAFAQWSTQWMWDRYIPDSVLITENLAKNGVTLVRGTFRFSRSASVATITFASTLQKQRANWAVTTLCYNDTTSGMTDCANSGLSAGARNFLGVAILSGLMAAIGGYDGDRDGDAAGREFDARRREREADAARASARQRENDRLDKEWSKMFDTGPSLSPPGTVN